MKIAAAIHNNQHIVGIVDTAKQIITKFKLTDAQAKLGALSIVEMSAQNLPLPDLAPESIPLAQIKLLAPIPHPKRNIFCAGKNYSEHVQEVAKSGLFNPPTLTTDLPEYPIIFTKLPQTVIATNEPILNHKNITQQLDYEAELAVIIGTGGTNIDAKDAMNHVWGYTIVNDVTARDLQKRHVQWHLGKSLDSFCPMGPWLVSKNEIDINNTKIECRVNGELRQQGNTKELIFNIPTLIATISAGITLFPGDIIATGTPSGVGIGFNPPKLLQPGDEVFITISGIGELVNKVSQ